MLRAEKNKKLYMGSCQHFHICVVPPQLHFQEYTSKYRVNK